jgi:hypothetical protein
MRSEINLAPVPRSVDWRQAVVFAIPSPELSLQSLGFEFDQPRGESESEQRRKDPESLRTRDAPQGLVYSTAPLRSA